MQIAADALDEEDGRPSWSPSALAPGLANEAPPVKAARGVDDLDDDATPIVSLLDGSVAEGTGAGTSGQLTVQLSAPSGRTVAVDWSTQTAPRLRATTTP